MSLRQRKHIDIRNIGNMAKLTTAKRKKIPKSEFGLPGEKKYPMPDRKHAINAKARATQMEKKGKLSAASKAKIDAKANKVLGKKKPAKKKEGQMSHVSAKRIDKYAASKKKYYE